MTTQKLLMQRQLDALGALVTGNALEAVKEEVSPQ